MSYVVALLTEDGVVWRGRSGPRGGDVGEGAVRQDVHQGGQRARARRRTDYVLQDLQTRYELLFLQLISDIVTVLLTFATVMMRYVNYLFMDDCFA